MPLRTVPRPSLDPQNEEPIPINWRRGMLRVWLLVSAAWIMAWVIYLLLLYVLQGGFKETGEFLAVPVVLFGPPIALLLFGLAAGWAFRGFKVDDRPPTA
jgi:hypothetical protein